MQAAQLNALIEAYSVALGAGRAGEVAAAVKRLGAAIGKGGSQTAANLLDQLNKKHVERSPRDDLLVEAVLPAFEALLGLLKEAGAKKPSVAVLKALLEFLGGHREASVSDIESVIERTVASASRGKGKPGAPAVDTKQLTDSYLRRLESTLGEDAKFRLVFRELSNDKRITRIQAVEIASRFFAPLPASTPRPKALQKILHRHEKLLESRAASSTIGGQAA